MIVLDASVLIGHFESADPHHADATELLLYYAAEPFGSSVVTLAEVYVGAARAGHAERLARLLERVRVEPLDLPAAAARRLGEMRASTGLKMPDCCVLYTAEHHGAAVATFDERLASRAADLGLEVARRRDHSGPELTTQPITGADLAAGRVRIPADTKPVLPDTKGVVQIVLRGLDIEVRWDPRNGPDRPRSGVLGVGSARLASAVAENEILTVALSPEGRIELT
ncbi:PIN domain-containing protein [Mycolicibacterium sp. ND9-15]|uniref:type II toxin-antitoxin system VapC family toxin n=1 Tax=Mycolicibacterium sp. ND9-15 TaxID=3042320 RepID=UPI002DDA5F48|nr:PIN domain-containing protein [Mycolicibacterium sp. ND9-15]WSE54967.1 PIN domain-containing protein [Mycolicibacterium sp. ND9-15]